MTVARMTRREQSAMQTRTMIFNSALSLFSKRGFDSVTIDDICAHAGVSRGTFYNHFKSKEQVTVEQLLKVDEYNEELIERIRSQKSYLERMIAYTARRMAHIESMGANMIKVAYHSQLGPGHKDKAIYSRGLAIRDRVEDLIREGQQAGELRTDYSAKRITHMLMSSLRGIIFEWCLQDGDFELQQAAQDAVELTLSGLKAERVSLSPVPAIIEAG